jgi:UDP-glucose 6-dehydrogenase
MIAYARLRQLDFRLLEATLEVNRAQALHTVELAEVAAGGLGGRTVAVLGLAFKAGTDDVRSSQAYPIVKELLRRGARVRLHDPVVGELFRVGLPAACSRQFADRIMLCSEFLDALHGADLALILADWPDYVRARSAVWTALRLRLVVDARRCLDEGRLFRAGVRVVALGR